MSPLIENFRYCASLWFDDRLTGPEIRRLMNDVYGAMRRLDTHLDDHPDHEDAKEAYRDLARIWNSMVIEKQRLQSEAQDRVGPDYRPQCASAGEWVNPSMSGFHWGCCGCSHKMIVEFRVRGRDGKVRDDCRVEYRTFGVN